MANSLTSPRASYRLQFNAQFGFDDAARIAPYLSRLGVSHVYASPYLKARPGSMHGYDIVAHDQLNPELGDAAAFARMLAAFKQHDLRQILDFVPNHMGVGGADNPLWLDVLEWGMDSAYAGWFDIDWEPDHRYLRGKLLVPLLGDQYGVELASGKLQLKFDAAAGEFSVWAYDVHKLPICPLYYQRILGDALPSLEWLGDDFASIMEWRPQIKRRASELKQQLASLIAIDESARSMLADTLARFNDRSATSRRELHALIQLQHWRATHFRVAGDDINYRRFFNINELAGIRIELPDVFDHVHRLLLQLLSTDAIDGLRIDHIDGLIDPQGYLKRLRAAMEQLLAPNMRHKQTYLIVEKILSQDEQLAEEWPVAGTTGYDFCNQVLGLFIKPQSEARFTETYQAFTRQAQSFMAVVRHSKLRIMNNEMASELNVLARDAARVARQTPETADFTKNLLLRAIREVIACFTVYRTYVDGRGQVSDEDIQRIKAAVHQARINEREIDPSVFDFVERLWCGELIAQRKGFIRHTVLRCAMKLQQYSGPVMAKGLEDTAFYRFNRFIALNEVGGQPDVFGLSIEQFHAQNARRAQRWPNSMLCTATHDTKRGEDARARLAVLSEIPDEWAQQVTSWTTLLGSESLPAPADLYLFYQMLLGSWPAELTGCAELSPEILAEFVQRLKTVMLKSVREAKQLTTWIRPDEDYEAQLISFVERALNPDKSAAFLQNFREFQHQVALAGIRNSLVQTVLRLSVPGMPDTYQGTELWDFNMVDPDNRRPVDFETRVALLDSVSQQLRTNRRGCWAEYLDEWRDGRIKLAVLHSLLQARRSHEALFSQGSYQPIAVIGPESDGVCAFLRQHGEICMLVIVARFHATQSALSQTDVALPEPLMQCTWRELFTRQTCSPSPAINVGMLLEQLPVAVLIST